MNAVVLVLNAGSSSLKYSLVDPETGETHASGLVERIGEADGRVTHRSSGDTHSANVRIHDHEAAIQAALDAFEEHGPALQSAGLEAVGHRVVHGGTRFSAPTVIDDETLEGVRGLIPLAPLHNGANLEGMDVARRLFPDLPQVAVFDTAFHHTLEAHAYTYAVPLSWRDDHGVRRYGFHGTSCAYVSREAARMLEIPPEAANLIVLHLGNGASATAVRGGRSVETSMGLTPLEGLVMGSRSGDVDPALVGYVHRQLGWSIEDVDRALTQESGLEGLAGDNDLRVVQDLVASGDPRGRLAFDVYCHRIRKYVGAYYAVLGTVDAVVFTAGVGENSPLVRSASLSGMDRLGIRIDDERNRAVGPGDAAVISPDGSEVAVLVVPTNEEYEIARQVMSVVPGAPR
jgi:acetate kinase